MLDSYDDDIINFAAFIPPICEQIAAEAGYDSIDEYLLARDRKHPKYPARRYLECVNEYGAENRVCKKEKERWMELKAVQNGNKVDWNKKNEEEVHKMLKKDAIQAGYTEGYYLKKDPKYLEYVTREYQKCIAKHGVGSENTKCRTAKICLLRIKALQNGN